MEVDPPSLKRAPQVQVEGSGSSEPRLSFGAGALEPPKWLRRTLPKPDNGDGLPRSTLLYTLSDPTAAAVLRHEDCAGSEGVVAVQCPRTKNWVVLSTTNLVDGVWHVRKLLKQSGMNVALLSLHIEKVLERNSGPLWHNWATLWDDQGYFWEFPRPKASLGHGVEASAHITACAEILTIFDPQSTAGHKPAVAMGPAKLAKLTNALPPVVYQAGSGEWHVWWKRPGDAVLVYGIDDFLLLRSESDTGHAGDEKRMRKDGIVVPFQKHEWRSAANRRKLWTAMRVRCREQLCGLAERALEAGTPPAATEEYVLRVLAAIDAEKKQRIDAGLAAVGELPPCLAIKPDFTYTVDAKPNFWATTLEKGMRVYLFYEEGQLCISDRMHLNADNLTAVTLATRVADPKGTSQFEVRVTTDHKYETRKRIFMTMDHLKKDGYVGLESAVEALMRDFYEGRTDGEWPSRRCHVLGRRTGKYMSPSCLSCPFPGWRCAAAEENRWSRVADVVVENAKMEEAMSAVKL